MTAGRQVAHSGGRRVGGYRKDARTNAAAAAIPTFPMLPGLAGTARL